MSGLGMTCLRVPLVLTEAGEALGFGGEVAFGLSLELLRRVSPSAARKLHDHTSPKPFAIALDIHDAFGRRPTAVAAIVARGLRAPPPLTLPLGVTVARGRSLSAPQTSHPDNRDVRRPGAKEADGRELQPA